MFFVASLVATKVSCVDVRREMLRSLNRKSEKLFDASLLSNHLLHK